MMMMMGRVIKCDVLKGMRGVVFSMTYLDEFL